MRMALVVVVVAGCSRHEATPPPPVPVPVPAHVEPGAFVVPSGVEALELAGPQPFEVERYLESHPATFPTHGTVTVPPGAYVQAKVATATPELVAWANANHIVLDVVCGDTLPVAIAQLSCREPGASAIEAIARMQHLVTLDLSVAVELTDEDLARLPVLPELDAFSFLFGHMTNAGLAKLRMPHLHKLAISGNRIRNEGVASLATFRELTYLDVTTTDIDDTELGKLGSLSQLTDLSLSENDITDVGVAKLAALTKLKWLELDGTKVTDHVLDEMEPFTQLVRLDVLDTNVSDAACAAFNKKRGGDVCVRTQQAHGGNEPPTKTKVMTIETLEVVDMGTADGPLADQLRTQRLAAKGRMLIVETTATWCKPCIAITKYIGDPAMTRALAGVTLVRVDIDQFASELTANGFTDSSVPWFVMFDDKLQVKDKITSAEWDDDVPANMAPVLGAFARGTLTKRRY
jgi:hypothetical protein